MDGTAPQAIFPAVAIESEQDLPAALVTLGVERERPVLVLVGAAAGLDAGVRRRLAAVFRQRLCPLLHRLGAAVVDGGTDAGVMAEIGRAREATGGAFPLVGVVPDALISIPGSGSPRGSAPAPGHRLLLVPGTEWGDEIPWMQAVAARLAGACGAATLVAGGGRVTRLDVRASLAAGRPTVILAGSGGTADQLAASRPAHALLRVVPEAADWSGLEELLSRLLHRNAGG